MLSTIWSLRYSVVGVATLLLASGCSNGRPKTTLSYHATALVKNEAGKINEGRKQSGEVIFSDHLRESSFDLIADDHQKIRVKIVPTTGSTAQVTLYHEDQSKELQMAEGQVEEVFFEKSNVGVRLQVESIR